ncbi:MAG: class I SAM-dependent methyltransferase, partial [Ignavibacteriales bacterium]|nr:class I SAM-dependent methyltransferase [Ignavibacteriales bacterium]
YIQEKYSSYFDLIVSRATVKLKDLCELNFDLIKNHGWIISIKGGSLANEIHEANECFNKNIRLIKIINLFYKPTNTKNEKDKKLIILEIIK